MSDSSRSCVANTPNIDLQARRAVIAGAESPARKQSPGRQSVALPKEQGARALCQKYCIAGCLPSDDIPSLQGLAREQKREDDMASQALSWVSCRGPFVCSDKSMAHPLCVLDLQ